MLVRFAGPKGSILAYSAIADRLLCWSRRIGHPLTLADVEVAVLPGWNSPGVWGAVRDEVLDEAPAPTPLGSRVIRVETSGKGCGGMRGSLLAVDDEICSYAGGVPLTMYAGGPNLCPLSGAVNSEGVIVVQYVEALPPGTDCATWNPNPDPPAPVAPTISSVTPDCAVGWMGASHTIVGTGLADATKVFIGDEADGEIFNITARAATSLKASHGEIENTQFWTTTITVVTPSGRVSAPFRMVPPGNSC